MKQFVRISLAAQRGIGKIASIFSRPSQKKDSDLLSDDRGEAYIGEVVKILIAVVIGALVLGLLYALIQGLFPTISDKITELFSFNGGE